MNYEPAKELKDAGFPQKLSCGHCGDHQNGYNDAYKPTLSELIEACGGVLLWGCKDHSYYASKQFCSTEHPTGTEPVIEADAKGSTPEEAVARLWLALNKK